MVAKKNVRGGRWLRRGEKALIVAALLVVAGLLGYRQFSSPAFAAASPVRGAVLADGDVSIRIELRKLPLGPGVIKPGSFRVLIDGRRITAEDITIGDTYLDVRQQLEDGDHVVTVSGLGALRRQTRSWSFSVDSVAPVVESTSLSPAESGEESGSVGLEVDFSEPVSVTLSVDGTTVSLPATPSASLDTTLALASGKHEFELRARDAAGNEVVDEWTDWVDREAPTVELSSQLGGVWKKPPSRLRVTVTDDAIEQVTVTGTVDGKPFPAAKAGEAGETRRTFTLQLPTLKDGRHKLVVEVRDAAGHVVRREGDVQVQRAAKEPPLDIEYIRPLLAGLRIDLSARTLVLLDAEGNVLHTYRVAVGQRKYPTPTGNFRIVKLEVNPTWDPPDSDWAKGEKPVPPGPNNPLGTRWIGLSAPSIGIHGTNAPGSIGTAASHGCIRMRTYQVEELFRVVKRGMPVAIVP